MNNEFSPSLNFRVHLKVFCRKLDSIWLLNFHKRLLRRKMYDFSVFSRPVTSSGQGHVNSAIGIALLRLYRLGLIIFFLISRHILLESFNRVLLFDRLIDYYYTHFCYFCLAHNHRPRSWLSLQLLQS